MRKSVLALVLMAAPAMAQNLVFSAAPMETCLGLTEDYRNKAMCIGQAAQACIEATPGGYSTAGMVGCFDAELQWWDARLNATYREVMATAKAMDRDKADYAPSRVEALKAMQRAWIAFRDGKCAFARSEWGGGTGAGPAGVDCLLRETATQTLYLEMSLGLG